MWNLHYRDFHLSCDTTREKGSRQMFIYILNVFCNFVYYFVNLLIFEIMSVYWESKNYIKKIHRFQSFVFDIIPENNYQYSKIE